MGLFDLRCALSGLSLTGAMARRPFRSAIVLLGEDRGRFVPVFPPVGGHYDRYGRIELWGDDLAQKAHANFACSVLSLLWQAGVVSTTAPTVLARQIARGDFGGDAGALLAHIAQSAFDGFSVSLGGRTLYPCLYREDVAEAIEADTSPDLLAAPPLRLPILDDFGPLPPESVDVLARFGRVLRWADRHGGLRPVDPEDARQHDPEDFDRFAREAYRRDPVLRAFLTAWLASDTEARDARRELESPPAEPPTAPFEPGMIAQVLSARGVAPDECEALVRAAERAADPAAVARVLCATRPANAAVLAEFDGVIGRDGEFHTLRGEIYPDAIVRYLLADLVVIVREGERVVAGQRLTAGESAPADEVRILGPSHVADALTTELAGLLEVSTGRARLLVEPMLEHVRIDETRHRLSAARWDDWFTRNEGLPFRAEVVLTGYPVLLRHVDPTLDAVEAALQRRYELAQRMGEDDVYRLPADLADEPRSAS